MSVIIKRWVDLYCTYYTYRMLSQIVTGSTLALLQFYNLLGYVVYLYTTPR